jgi:ferritin-like metal-binding protein YciE
LIDMASQLGLPRVPALLQANLREEEEALSTVKGLSKTAMSGTATSMKR